MSLGTEECRRVKKKFCSFLNYAFVYLKNRNDYNNFFMTKLVRAKQNRQISQKKLKKLCNIKCNMIYFIKGLIFC